MKGIHAEVVKRLIGAGWLTELVRFAIVHSYPLTSDEVADAVIKTIDRDKEDEREKVLPLVTKLKPIPSVIEALVGGIGAHGFFQLGLKLARLHPDPQPLYEQLVVDAAEAAGDDIGDLFEVVKSGVSKDVYEAYIRGCIEWADPVFLKKVAKIGKRRVTRAEWEQVVRMNLDVYQNVPEARMAAKAAGRKLTTKEIDGCVLKLMMDGEIGSALSIIEKEKRQFRDDELKAFSRE